MSFVTQLRLLFSRRFIKRTCQSIFTSALFALSGLLIDSISVYAVRTCQIIVIRIASTILTFAIQIGALITRCVQ